MSNTYLTTEALANRIHYDPRTIRNRLKDSVLIEGKHYFRPFGGRKILYIWEAIERDMRGEPVTPETSAVPAPSSNKRSEISNTSSDGVSVAPQDTGIPMANGGVCNG